MGRASSSTGGTDYFPFSCLHEQGRPDALDDPAEPPPAPPQRGRVEPHGLDTERELWVEEDSEARDVTVEPPGQLAAEEDAPCEEGEEGEGGGGVEEGEEEAVGDPPEPAPHVGGGI